MTASALALIGFTVVISSFISGVFGMAGGMVLLGVLLVYFDVATGMVLFSILQITANGWRALHWRRFVLWPIFYWYVAGSILAFAVMRSIAYVPDKAMVYILLGLMPFMVEVLPQSMRPNIEWRGVPFVTGIFTTVIQFLAGVGGLFLDIFFNKSRLDRKTTNATKAITQTFSHVIRAAYFGSLAGVSELKFVVWGPGIVLALAGAIAAPFVVERMSDHGFRQWTRGIIFTIAVVYLIRGGLLLWQSAWTRLLAGPDDAGDPHHVLERQCALGMVGVERFELDLLGGLALEFLDHHLAVLGLDHDAVAAPHGRRRRHDDDVAVAVGRLHGLAGDFQRVGMLVGYRGKCDLVPTLADRKAAIIEIAACAGFGEADQRHRLRSPVRTLRSTTQRIQRSRRWPRAPWRSTRLRASAPVRPE